MTAAPLPSGRDERTLAIENASYRWAYLILTCGLLLDINVRNYFHFTGNGDLLLLVIVASLFCSIYQARARVMTRALIYVMLIAGVVAAGIAVLVTRIRPHHH